MSYFGEPPAYLSEAPQTTNTTKGSKNELPSDSFTQGEATKLAVSEQAILGAILISSRESNKVLLNEIFSTVKTTDFLTPEHKIIFQTMKGLHEEKVFSDASTVFQRIQHDNPNTFKDATYLFAIESQSASQIQENFTVHLDLLRRSGSFRELQEVGRKIEKLGEGGGVVLESLVKATELIKTVSRDSKVETVLIKDSLVEFLEDLENRFNGIGKSEWETGFEELDEVFYIEPGNLVVLAGRPSMGKTTLSLNIMKNWSVTGDMPSLFVSLEMPKIEIMQSLISSIGKVELNNLKRGSVKQEDWVGINNGVTSLDSSKMLINEQAGISIEDLRVIIEDAIVNHGIRAVTIDYIGLLRSDKRTGNRQEEVSLISRELKSIAKEYGIVILALSQLSRELERRVDKRPIMSDLRESGAIEQDADKIIFIYRDEVYNPDTEYKGTAEVIVGKNRGGESGGKARLSTALQYASFNNFYIDNYSPY